MGSPTLAYLPGFRSSVELALDILDRADRGELHPEIEGEARGEFLRALSSRIVTLVGEAAATITREPFTATLEPDASHLSPTDQARVVILAVEDRVQCRYLELIATATGTSGTVH